MASQNQHLENVERHARNGNSNNPQLSNTQDSANENETGDREGTMNTYTFSANASLRLRESFGMFGSTDPALQLPSGMSSSSTSLRVPTAANRHDPLPPPPPPRSSHRGSPNAPLLPPHLGSSISGGGGPAAMDGDADGQVGPYDVLCGRHKHAFRNVGNRRFRVTVSMNLSRYTAAPTKGDKSKVILSVIEMIRAVGGRFLKWSSKRRMWVELDEKQTREKVGHALRDMAVTRSQSGKLGKDDDDYDDDHCRQRHRAASAVRRSNKQLGDGVYCYDDRYGYDVDDDDNFSALSASSDGFEDTSEPDFHDLSSPSEALNQKPSALPSHCPDGQVRSTFVRPPQLSSFKLSPEELQDLVHAQATEPGTPIDRHQHLHQHSLPCQDLLCGGGSPAAHGLLTRTHPIESSDMGASAQRQQRFPARPIDSTLVDSLILNMEEVQRLMAAEMIALESGTGGDGGHANAAPLPAGDQQRSFSYVFGGEDEMNKEQHHQHRLHHDDDSDSCASRQFRGK